MVQIGAPFQSLIKVTYRAALYPSGFICSGVTFTNITMMMHGRYGGDDVPIYANVVGWPSVSQLPDHGFTAS